MITRARGKRPPRKLQPDAISSTKKLKRSRAASHATLSSASEVHLSGAVLVKCIAEATAACCLKWPPGTQLWVKLRGMCHWPVAMWAMELCMKKDVPQLLTSFKPEHVVVRFYGEHSSMWVRLEDLTPVEMAHDSHLDRLSAMRAHPKLKHKLALVEAAMEELSEAHSDCCLEVQRMLQLHNDYLANSDAPDICYLCREEGASLVCGHCERLLHPLCLQPPALSVDTLQGSSWECPSCGEPNQVGAGGSMSPDKEKQVERMGLTPDWIIQVTAFKVFQLDPPTPEQPFIRGLLDPCTNSMLAPNIPAEKLYDKVENGLKVSNSWAGYHILLNPDYSAQILWRFVNRAIDEVENHQVPTVVLVCRNSTDTAYFQRLRPYPRVMLRRHKCLFKDYDKTPIGFGVVVFCIAKSSCRELYGRFFDAFALEGEPNIPIDRHIMHSPEFYSLLERLRQHAELHQRDHWIECSSCGKWRIISYAKMSEAKDTDWVCTLLRPPYSSCRTPQSKRELLGVRYAVQGVDGCDSTDELAPPEHPKGLLLQQPAPAAQPQVAALVGRVPQQQPQGEPPNQLGPPQGCPGVGKIDEGTPLSSAQKDSREKASIGKAPPTTTAPAPASGAAQDVLQATPSTASADKPWGEAPLARLISSGSTDSNDSSCTNALPKLDATIAIAALPSSSGSPDTASPGAAAVPSGAASPNDASPGATPVSTAAASPGAPAVPGAAASPDDASPGTTAVSTAAASPGAAAVPSGAASADDASPGMAVLAGAAKGKLPDMPEGITASIKAASAASAAASTAASTAGVAPQQGQAAAALKARPTVTDEDISKWIQLPRQGSKDRATCGAPSAEEPWQVLTALELGRQARIAANRAYLAGLQLGPQSMSRGEVRPLQVADPVVLAAARQLATTAALSQAKSQLDEARKQLSARQKTRAREGTRLRSALTTLEAQAAADAQQVLSAQQAHEELLQNLPSYLSPAVQARPHPPVSAPEGKVGRPSHATAVQAPALGALVPSHQPPSPALRPHLKKTAPKLMPSQAAPNITAPLPDDWTGKVVRTGPAQMPRHSASAVAPRQEVSSAVAQAALRATPTSSALNASSASSGGPFAMQQAVRQPTILQQALGQTAPARHAYSALEQSAQLASLPQGAYSIQWLAAATAHGQGQTQAHGQGQGQGQAQTQAQASRLQQRVAAPWASSQPALKRYKLSCPSEGAGHPTGSAAVATAAHVPMRMRGEAPAAISRHRSLSSSAERPPEGLVTGLMGSKAQQRGLTTQQMGSMTQQRGLATQQMGSTSQQAPRLPQPWAGTATAVHPAQNPAAPSATLSPRAAAAHTHPDATIVSSCTAQPRLTQPQSAWAGTSVQLARSRQAIPSRQTTSPPPLQARSLMPQHCRPVPALPTSAGPLSSVSAPQPVVAAPAALVMAASISAASCLEGPGTSLLQAVAAQQQAVTTQQQLVCMRPPSQASSTQSDAHEVKAGPQTFSHPHQLQDLVPTCPLSIASALCLRPDSAAHDPSLEVHPSVPNNSPGGPAQPHQRSPAQGWVAESSAAAHRVATVSSAGGTAAAPPSPGERRPDSMLSACVSPDLQAPASLGLPAELLALFNQSAGCDSQGSRYQPSPKASNALPDIHLPVHSALWHPGGSHKSIKDKVSSQQQVNPMLGMY